MPKIEIMINGKAYPCRQTMGAMLRFKKETGKEVTELGNSLSDMCAYLFCCVASACKHDGVKFDMSLMDFADRMSPLGNASADGHSRWQHRFALQ